MDRTYRQWSVRAGDAVQRTERVGGTVRREEVPVDDRSVEGVGTEAGRGIAQRARDEGFTDQVRNP